MTKTQRRQKMELQLRRQDRDPLVLKSLPPTVKSAEESRSLAEKLVSQVAWMQEKGIDGSLAKPDRPHSTQKSPRPGTVIFFSIVP